MKNEILISVLRQLRDGYPRRPHHFPYSLALIGLRDVRDYKVSSGDTERLNTASPFNIKVASLTMQNFNAIEVAALYQQHTEETGQLFSAAATNRAFELTQGQPWLVNALAKEIVEELVPDVTQSIELSHVNQAKEILIRRRDTHIDSLGERLMEPRIKVILEPILAGRELGDVPTDDIQFVLDLGLSCMDPEGGLTIANPIYREVLPRILTITPMASLPQIKPTWLTSEGKLDADALLNTFLMFWRQHGQPLLRSASYHEIAPHIVMMAFLHRVVNGGGSLEREYAMTYGRSETIGSDRMDLCLRYMDVTLAIELKVWRQGERDPLQRGLVQLDRYLAGLSLNAGWLVIFDRREGIARLSERTTTEMAVTAGDRSITVIRG